MTDNQFYALISVIAGGLGGIGAVIRFSVSRIVKSLDDSSGAMLKHVEAMAVLATKIDAISAFVQDAKEREARSEAAQERERELTPVEGVPIRGAAGGLYRRKKSEPAGE